MWFVNGDFNVSVFVDSDTTPWDLEDWFCETLPLVAAEIDVFSLFPRKEGASFVQMEDEEITFWGDDGLFRLEVQSQEE